MLQEITTFRPAVSRSRGDVQSTLLRPCIQSKVFGSPETEPYRRVPREETRGERVSFSLILVVRQVDNFYASV